jgi:hypothetical protein
MSFCIHRRTVRQTGRDEYEVEIGPLVETTMTLHGAKERVKELHAEEIADKVLSINAVYHGVVRPQFAVLDHSGKVIFTYGT